MKRIWQLIADVLIHRPMAVLAVGALLTGGLALGLPRLDFETSEEAMISPESDVFRENVRYQRAFGGEAMLVLYTGDLTTITNAGNLARLDAIERELRGTAQFTSIIGPLTALRFAQNQLAIAPELLMRAAGREGGEGVADIMAIEMERLAAAGPQRLDNPAFVDFLVHGPDGEIRASMRDAFPDEGHALLIARVVGNATVDALGEASVTVKDIVNKIPLDGVQSLATGPPTLLKDINDYLQGGMATLGLIAVVVMILILGALFRVRWRLLSLASVAAGTIWAFGALGLLGVPLSLVTVSGLPILIGLGVDFSIQVHNRVDEELGTGATASAAVRRTMAYLTPPLLVAMVAAVAGFLALQASRVPMVRDFGVLLVIGVIALVISAITVTTAVLVLGQRQAPAAAPAPPRGGRLLERIVAAMTALPSRVVLPVAAASVLVLAAGIAVEDRVPVVTDPERWVSQQSDVVQELDQLRESAGFSSELGLLIEADDVTADHVVAWMHAFATEQLAKHPDELVRATSLPGIAEDVTGVAPDGADIDALLTVAPADIATTFVNGDRTKANLIFPVAPFIDREALLDDIRADLDPPDGVQVTPSGLLVVGVELVHGLEANRSTMTLVAVGAVGLWLLLTRRSRSALLTLVPVILAVGASALVIWALGMELTPLTTVAAPLVIAVSTEFAVLITARYEEERAAGRTPAEAVARGAARIGRAFVASGLTLVGGFAVLAFAPLPLLREFGLLVALNVLIALACALVVLPPLLVWAEQHPRLTGLRAPTATTPPASELPSKEMVLR